MNFNTNDIPTSMPPEEKDKLVAAMKQIFPAKETTMTPQDTMRLALEAVLAGLNTMYVQGFTRMKMEEAEEALRSALAQQGEQQPDTSTWCKYIAAMIGCYIGDDEDSERVKAIAGIIERRLWSLPKAAPAAQPDRTGMTYYRNDKCKAESAASPDCICWTPTAPAAQQGEQQPYLYVYEYVSSFGIHREFTPRPVNGMAPTRTVPLYTAAPAAQPLTVVSSYKCDLDKVRRDEKEKSEAWLKQHGIGADK